MENALKFSYPKRQFAIRALTLYCMLAAALAFTALSRVSLFWIIILFFIFFVFIFITNVSPLFTSHELAADSLMLRQGFAFSARFPFSNVEKVELHPEPLWTFMIQRRRVKGRIILAGGNAGLVAIRLKSGRRFGALLFRFGSELVIDLKQPEEFVKLVNEKLQISKV
jgi:hypothetical protein